MTSYKLIGYFEYKNKKTGAPMICFFIGSEASNVKGLKVDTIFCDKEKVTGEIKLGAVLTVNADLRGFVQSVNFN